MREEPAFALVCWTLSRILVGVLEQQAQQATDDDLSWGFLLSQLLQFLLSGNPGVPGAAPASNQHGRVDTMCKPAGRTHRDHHTIRSVCAQNWCVLCARLEPGRQPPLSWRCSPRRRAALVSTRTDADAGLRDDGKSEKVRTSIHGGGSHQRHIRWLAHAGLAITTWGAWRLEGPRAQHIIIGRGRIAYAPPPPHAAPSSSVFVRCYFRAAAAAAAAAAPPRGRDAAALPQA